MGVNRRHVTRAETGWLLGRQDGHCPLCGEKLVRPDSADNDLDPVEVDHRRPLSQGGADELGNMQLVHATCHARKTAGESGD